MITCHAASKNFGSVVAAADVSVRCEDGAITGLLGPNGAGKSTVLRMIGGLLHPTRGSVDVDGANPQTHPLQVRRKLALLPDARGLYPRLTAREHIEFFGRLHGMHSEVLAEAMDAIATQLQMEDLLARQVSGFSQGERMKVILARALIHGPQNVVLDEPTNGLDVMSARAVRSLVQQLRSDGRCVLYSSHLMHEVADICDTIYVMARGEVVASGTAHELIEQTQSRTLEDAFVALVGLGDSA